MRDASGYGVQRHPLVPQYLDIVVGTSKQREVI